MNLTGRYQFKPGIGGALVVYVEVHDDHGFHWRKGRRTDLKDLEPAVADGWRFPEERYGTLIAFGPDIGKRYKDYLKD